MSFLDSLSPYDISRWPTGFTNLLSAAQRQQQPLPAQAQQPYAPSMEQWANPFGAAMSGTQHGTLQPYINRMTQNASNALYGGLLPYSPQPMVAGNAGGTPQNSTVPNFNIPGLLNSNFGQRAWMK